MIGWRGKYLPHLPPPPFLSPFSLSFPPEAATGARRRRLCGGPPPPARARPRGVGGVDTVWRRAAGEQRRWPRPLAPSARAPADGRRGSAFPRSVRSLVYSPSLSLLYLILSCIYCSKINSPLGLLFSPFSLTNLTVIFFGFVGCDLLGYTGF